MSQAKPEPTCQTPLKQVDGNSPDVEQGLLSSSGGQNCKNRDYRTLAISSIICGLSCIGLLSLIYSVKARAMNKGNPGLANQEEKAMEYSRKALRFGILAIVCWVLLLICLPLLAGLVSYILTLKD